MKITVIGGGSFVWSLGLCNQLIRSERLSDVSVTLMDVDPAGLDLVRQAAEICNRKKGSPIRMDKTTDLLPALDGADFVFVSIAVGGLDAMQHDLQIPERYGIWQTVGDTVGPGGWCRALRNIPVFHDIAATMHERCPGA
jgi:alpha-galactosidase/6-phospho-beta-glucosidase family protein